MPVKRFFFFVFFFFFFFFCGLMHLTWSQLHSIFATESILLMPPAYWLISQSTCIMGYALMVYLIWPKSWPLILPIKWWKTTKKTPFLTGLPNPKVHFLRVKTQEGGHSHMSVDIKCLLTDPPLFYTDLTPNDPPFFLSPHPMTPFFPLSYQFLHTNCKCLCASRAFWEIYKFCSNFNIRFAKFGLKLHFCTLNDPQFWESTSKRSHFFGAHTEWSPFFNKILHPMPPTFVLQ